MPRTARADAPGVTHHVLLRGVARCDVFRDDRDRLEFRERLERLIDEESFRCFAWAFMPNHVHLLLQTGPTPLKRLMARLATGYAGWHNRRHDRVGHLFQNRYKAIGVASQAYAEGLVVYICGNPLAGGRVVDVPALLRHPWTALPELMGTGPAGIVDSAAVLDWFGTTPAGARRELRRRIEVRERDRDAAESSEPAPRPARADPLGDLFARLCAERGLSASEVTGRSRRPEIAELRVAFVLRAHHGLGAPLVEIERRLGWSSGAASKVLARARAQRRRGVSP